MDLTSSTIPEICSFLAARIRAARLDKKCSQKVMAEAAGIPLRTYKRIELKGNGSIKNLVQILRALGKIRGLEVLIPQPSSRPTKIERVERVRLRQRERP